jgi:acyl transferase domain-containing protein
MTDLMTAIVGLLARGEIDHRTAQQLVIAAKAGAPAESESRPPGRAEPIAVIGVAAQLPGAPAYERFWDVLMAGEDRGEAAPARRRELCMPVLDGLAPARAFLHAAWVEDIDLFDARFFGVPSAEARVMDPQQRRFLQVAYHCLEDAGHAGRVRGTKTGVYLSAGRTAYANHLAEITSYAVPGSIPSFAASRLSFWLDLHGPAFVSSATCVSSLLVLHQACRSLRNGECDAAIVGGVHLFPLPLGSAGRLTESAGIMSGDYRSRPFDHHGTGISHGEGVMALMLKPLERAQRDGDRIRAVIRGSAINNDGASAMLTAPNPRAHTELLVEAWHRAEIGPESLSYIETHGTGTALGDPIEIRGITDAVRRFTGRRQFIAAGSVKGNIGHLVDGMAGLSGLAKAMLVLQHGCVPPTVNLCEPNRHIDFLESPVFVPTEPLNLRARCGTAGPLRAAVSCFGFNGTNVHMVLEEAPQRERAAPWDDHRLLVFPISARSCASLRALAGAYGDSVGAVRPGDLAFSMWSGREHHPHRVAILASDRGEFSATCRKLAAAASQQWADLPNVWTAGTRRPTDSPVTELARQYVSGKDAPWRNQFGDDPAPRLVDLPLYPFDEESFWLGDLGAAPAAT